MDGVTIYTADPCRSCRNAKALLEKRGIPFVEVNLTKDPVGREELSRHTGMQSFPQIVVGERTIGGFEALVAADRAGTLRGLAA
jgi:glutaredoxin 3